MVAHPRTYNARGAVAIERRAARAGEARSSARLDNAAHLTDFNNRLKTPIKECDPDFHSFTPMNK
jgi:hypothetical protein